MALSNRAQPWSKAASDVVMWRVIQDLWHPETNPDGFVSLGLAENSLMHKELTEYVNANTQIAPRNLTYDDGGIGSRSCRSAVAHFLNRKFNPVFPVDKSQVCLTNGVSTAVETMATMLADPGDVFLLGQPYYGSFIPDIELRPGVEVKGVSFGKVDPLSLSAVSAYASAIENCNAQGKRVAGLVLCNPHNPLGRCYSHAYIVELMRLCNQHNIHLISDEIYALSVFQENVDDGPFTSLLSIPTDDLIDPALTHVIYGLSKDFGANGLRLGAIISQKNRALHDALVMVSLYSYPSSLIDALATKLLTDDEYVDWYVSENQRRLKRNYELVRDWADSHGIAYKKGVCAAFFLWVGLGTIWTRKRSRPDLNGQIPDLSKLTVQENGTYSVQNQPDILPTAGNPELIQTTENSQKQNEQQDVNTGGKVDYTIDTEIETALLDAKVFLASGKNFGSEEPGWVRIVFSQDEDNLREGLRRVERAMRLQSK